MPISPYLANLRNYVGHDPILTIGADAIIRNDKGQVLLQHRSDNQLWGLPGGVADIGEKPAQTVVREVFEETGLIVRPTCLVSLTQREILYPNGDQLSATGATFECEVISGILTIDSESLALQFFDPDKLPNMFTDFYKPFLINQRREGAYFEWDEAWLTIKN